MNAPACIAIKEEPMERMDTPQEESLMGCLAGATDNSHRKSEDQHSGQDNTTTRIDEEEFLPLPPKKAAKAAFPPGSSVRICRYKENNSSPFIPKILLGTVKEVGIDLADNGNRDTVFRVLITDCGCCNGNHSAGNFGGNSGIFRETELQFALGCPVWFSLDMGFRTVRDEAVVVGSEHMPAANKAPGATEGLRYSLQLQTGSFQILHGVHPGNITYRDPDNSDGTPDVTITNVPTLQNHPSTSALDLPPTRDATKIVPPIQCEPDKHLSQPLNENCEQQGHTDEQPMSPAEDSTNNPQTKEALHPSATAVPCKEFPTAAEESPHLSGANLPQVKLENEVAASFSDESNPTLEMTISEEEATNSKKTNTPQLPEMEAFSSKESARGTVTPDGRAVSSSERADGTILDHRRTSFSTTVSEDAAPAKSTTKKRKRNPKSDIVVNNNPFLFQNIKFGVVHACKYSKQELDRKFSSWEVGSMNIATIKNRCLCWHLNGVCNTGCPKAPDHGVVLTKKMAEELEKYLAPVTSPCGPIFGNEIPRFLRRWPHFRKRDASFIGGWASKIADKEGS